MFNTPDGLFPAQQGSDIEYVGAELAAHQHNAQRHQKLSGFDGCSSGHFHEPVSRRVRDGIENSVNLIAYPKLEPGSCTVERWDFQAATGNFASVASVDIPLDRPQAEATRVAGE